MFVFYLVILNIVFSGNYLYCRNCCESCKCCCCTKIGPNGPGSLKGKPTKRKPKNDIKVLQCSTYDHDTLQREFCFQNYSFLQKDNACWLTSYLLSAFNIPFFQNAIKNYIYDGKQEHYYLKIIQDLFNDMQTKQGVYDVDFDKYYRRFIEDGKINHKEFYKPQDHGGFSNDPNFMHLYILKDVPFCCYFDFYLVSLCQVATNLLSNDVLFKKQLNEFLQYSPPLYILNIVLNNIISNYLSKNGTPEYIINDSDDKNLKEIYITFTDPLFFVPKRKGDKPKYGVPIEGRYRNLILLAEKDIVEEFKELGKYFMKEGRKFFKSSKNGSISDFFAEMKQKMDRYTYELNAVICGGLHVISVVKDNKNNKTYDLHASYECDGLFSREIPNDFLDPENFCFLENTTCKKCKNGNCNLNHYSHACVFFVSVYRKNN